jgi:hypothetical protein
MLSPRLNDCPECADIPSLLKKIDCKLAELGNNLYNNISYMLNKPVPAVEILQLIGYRRILTYKYCNPNYVHKYSVKMIASRVIRLTLGCVSRCNEPERCLEEPCDIVIVPNPPTTTTTSSSSTSTTSTSSTSTSTSTTTTLPPTSTTTTSTTLCIGCTTTSTSSTTTTTTTASIPSILQGLKIETIYIAQRSDLQLLPNGYVHPCAEQVSGHGCDRGFFEVTGNDIYIGDSLMNNLGQGAPGVVTQSGKFTCVDYDNVPNALASPGPFWAGNPMSRYSEMTITAQQAAAIANAGLGNCNIEFKLVPTMVTYNVSCDDIPSPHENVTWTRISKPNGQVIYNGCPIGNIATVNICI